MASRSPAGKTPPRKAPGPQPAHILFRVGRQGYLLTRRFQRPQWARLQDAHEEHARNLLARAARENIAFAGRLRTTFAVDVAPLGQRADAAGVIGNVATLIGRHRLFLFRLGEAPTAQPRRVSELRMDVIPASPVPPDSDAAPAPRDLPSRMLIVVEGMREVPPRELGEDALELIAVLATAGAALRIAAVLAAWIAANFTPIGWIADAAMIGYGVWTVGIGFIDAMRRLLIVARDIQAARTRGDLKRLSAPLAKLLVEAGLTAMLAFFLKGLSKAKRGSGAGGKDAPAPASPPRQKAAPVPGSGSAKPAATTKPPPATKPPVDLDIERRNLQHAFKHAEDFGVSGNPNGTTLNQFRDAVQTHVNAPGTKEIAGIYRGNPVTHFVDPKTGLNVIRDESGKFLSGWKLSPKQLEHVLNTGKLGGG